MVSDGANESESIDGLAEKPRQVYAVPRRYDLATLFAISLAYALMFGVMRFIGFEPVAFAIVAGFFTVVGIAQALLFGGRAPRGASIVAGFTYWLVGLVVSMLASMPFREANWYALVAWVFPGVLCSGIAGSIAGYVAGALIGGVFLIADLTRKSASRFQRS